MIIFGVEKTKQKQMNSLPNDMINQIALILDNSTFFSFMQVSKAIFAGCTISPISTGKWLITDAVRIGNLPLIKMMIANDPTFGYPVDCDGTFIAIDMAAKYGHLEIIQFLHSVGYMGTSNVMRSYVNSETTEFLYLEGYPMDSGKVSHTIDIAAKHGHLEIIQFLHSVKYVGTSKSIWLAAKYNHYEIVEFLYLEGYMVGRDGVSHAIDVASKRGHLGIVQFLHSIGYVGTSDAMWLAVKYNHSEIVKFLYSEGYPMVRGVKL